MIKRARFHIIIIILFSLAFLFLTQSEQPIAHEDYDQTIRDLSALELLQADIVSRALNINSNSTIHHDDITTSLRAIEQQHNSLLIEYEEAKGFPRFGSALATHQDDLIEFISAVNILRSDAAVAQNAFIYLTTTARQRSKELLQQGNLREAVALEQLVSETVRFFFLYDADQQVKAEDAYRAYQQINQTAQGIENLAIIKYAEILLERKPDLDEKLRQIINHDYQRHISSLMTIYQFEYAELLDKSNSYRDGLTILYILLVIYTIFVIYRLFKLYSTLEQTIRKRTEKLEHTNKSLKREVMRREQIETDLIEAKQTAEISNLSKTMFLANMSHELRTPLNAIIGFSEFIREHTTKSLTPQKVSEYANDIFLAGTHLLAVINDILDLSQIETGEMQLFEKQCNMADIVAQSLILVEERRSKSNITVENKLQGQNLLLMVDDRRFKQVLVNILTNAIKFTPRLGVVIIDGYKNDTGSFTLVISDTGIGIEKDMIPVVLEPFKQVENSLSRSHEGTGLGLPISKQIIELHGGELQIESNLGSGTSIIITLPTERLLS
ncbi:ATP-binding protein [Kordiimonas sp. SCSIO 12610]|uniref:sensor histidine kinase n=1 Tax=Kordiimonas sp. SCSIO 12610 TaxID=2829597 RepID=UPI00210E399F|nr:ATP-binding protein [Kordiimonas sp. SCSIO 12610]UTW54744.1 hypothetical protein KFF44_13160 [Kordiimonas sp. SCSIO 12610]